MHNFLYTDDRRLYRIRTEIGENIQKQATDATEKEREIRKQQEIEAEKKVNSRKRA